MDHLWAPWRSTYLSKTRDPGCIFCKALEGHDDAVSLVVFRGQHSFVILNRFPYSSGHVMILPNAHVSSLLELGDHAALEMIRLTQRAESVLRAVYRPDGLNLGMNLGEAAGAGIEQHLHMHVLPRWRGDANFMTAVGGVRVIPEALEDTYAKLRPAFAGS